MTTSRTDALIKHIYTHNYEILCQLSFLVTGNTEIRSHLMKLWRYLINKDNLSMKLFYKIGWLKLELGLNIFYLRHAKYVIGYAVSGFSVWMFMCWCLCVVVVVLWVYNSFNLTSRSSNLLALFLGSLDLLCY